MISARRRAELVLAGALMLAITAPAMERAATLNGLRVVLDESNGTLSRLEYSGNVSAPAISTGPPGSLQQD